MMERIRIFASRFADLFRSRKLDQELKEELEFHLDMQIDENLRKGMNPKEARRQAQIELGGVDRIREECRDRRGFPFLTDSIQDIRYGARLLMRNPVFAFTAIATLTLGIGANTAIFSVVNAAMPRPLPFDHPEELIKVAYNWPEVKIEMSFNHMGLNFQELRQGSENTVEIARLHIQQVNLSGKEGAERISIGRVSDNFFSVLKMRTSTGRLFRSGDDQPEADPIAVISNGLWKRRFGGDPDVLGRSLTLNGVAYSIVGVLQTDNLPLELNVDLWIPLPARESGYNLVGGINVIGRLKPDINIEAAQTELNRAYQESIISRVRKSDDYLVAVKWENELSKETRSSLFLFLGVTGIVLLIACANIANLLLARTIAREDEMRLRAALGAGRIRIFRQLLAESLLLALLGGGMGMALTFWTRGLLITLVSKNLTYISSIPVDWRVFGFTLLVSAATAIIAGVVPAWRAACFSPALSMNEGRRATTGKGLRAVFRLFVAAEIALVLTLLISSGLLLKTFLLLRQIDLGFKPENILTAAVDPAAIKYPDAFARTEYFEQVLERLQTIPGVEAAGITTNLPFAGLTSSLSVDFKVEGSDEEIQSNAVFRYAQVSDGYFRTMNIPLLEGRLFSHSDRGNAAEVVIIDNSFARRYFAGKSPIGRQISGFGKDPLTIIGVVGEIKTNRLADASPQIYRPYFQRSAIAAPVWMTIVARASKKSKDPMKLAVLISQALQSVDPDQPAFYVRTLQDLTLNSIQRQRVRSYVVGAFTALALLLAFIGIYGVVSFSVNRRVHEIGIRMAHGATRAGIVKLILRENMIICMFGIILGAAGAITTGRFLASLLYGVTAYDASTFIIAIVFVTAVVFAAVLIPAYRAASSEPAACLRHE